jgi:TRAP-type C4-dicarboxylate transport system permease small subunit
MRQILRLMARTDDLVARFSRAVSRLLVISLVLLVTYSVILRYVFDDAPPHTDQIATFLVAGILFIGATATFVEKSQVRVLVFDQLMSDRTRQRVRMLTLLLMLGVVVLLNYEVWTEMHFMRDFGMDVQMWRGVRLWWPFLTLPIGLSLLSIVVLIETMRHAITLISPQLREGEEHDGTSTMSDESASV